MSREKSHISICGSDSNRNFNVSSDDKELSTYEKRYDKGTYEALPDIIIPDHLQDDYNFSESTKKSEVDNVTQEKSNSSRVGNLINLGRVVKNMRGIKEFSRQGILGKVRSSLVGQPKSTKGAIVSIPENVPKFFDGGIKSAIESLIRSRANPRLSQSSKELDKPKNEPKYQEGGTDRHYGEGVSRETRKSTIAVNW